MTLRDQQSAKLEKQAKVAAAAEAYALLHPTFGPAPPPPSPPVRATDPNLDATDDDMDYCEGLSRGFAALTVGEHKGRDFDGVVEALAQMNDKGTCLLLRQKLIEHVWTTKGQESV